MLNFFYILIGAAVVENLLFSRGFASKDMIMSDHSYRRICRVGALMGGLATVSSILIWSFLYFFGGYFKTTMSRYVLIVSGICLVYMIFYFFLPKKAELEAKANSIMEIAFSGSCLGAVVLAFSTKMSLVDTLAYTIGASLGLIGAMLLLHAGKERLEACRIPEIFKGIPITLIYLGILGLGFYGLLGHQLPT